MYITTEKGKETEVGAWLKNNQAAYNYSIVDDVKKYEPHTALKGGEDGLDFYKKIVEKSSMVLKKNGILAFEIGYNQGEAVKKLMEDNNYINVKVVKDLAGLDRVVIGELN